MQVTPSKRNTTGRESSRVPSAQRRGLRLLSALGVIPTLAIVLGCALMPLACALLARESMFGVRDTIGDARTLHRASADARELTLRLSAVRSEVEQAAALPPPSRPALTPSEDIASIAPRVERLLDNLGTPDFVDPSGWTRFRTDVKSFVDSSANLAADPTITSENLDANFLYWAAVRTDAADLSNRAESRAQIKDRLAGEQLKHARLAGLTGMAVAACGFVVFAITLASRLRRDAEATAAALDRIADLDTSTRLNPRSGPISAMLAPAYDRMARNVRVRVERAESSAKRSDVDRLIAEALESALSPGNVRAAVLNSMTAISQTLPMQMLLVTRDGSQLREEVASPLAPSQGCPVAGSTDCPAFRGRRTLIFRDQQARNTCPHFTSRHDIRAAACVPVAIGNSRFGVVHAGANSPGHIDVVLVGHLERLAELAARRFAQLSDMETTRRHANTDALTGLPNRRTFEERVAELLAEQVPFVLVMADLDHFKRLNDTYGHDAGDRTLEVFGRVLAGTVRATDLVARLGGEEFVLALPNMALHDAQITVDRVRMALGVTLSTADLPATTCSFGIVRCPGTGSLEELLRVADAGLYEAKRLGRDRAVVADQLLVEQVFGPGNDPELRAKGQRMQRISMPD